MAEITQILSSPPDPAPNRNTDTPAEFSDNVDAYLAWQSTNVSEENNFAQQVNAVADEINQLEYTFYSGIPSVVNKTSSGTLSASDLTGKYVTNYGATGATNQTWPTIALGQECTLFVETAQYHRVTAPTGQVFYIGEDTSASGGYLRSNTVGSWIRIKALNQGLTVLDYDGIWYYDE